jgi:hypothetical protein
MLRIHTFFAVLICALLSSATACKKSDSGGGTGTGGAAPGSSTGGTVGVATGGTTGGTAATGGGAGMSAAPANMPDPTCKAMPTMTAPACQNCSCTPDAMGGCLTELMACQGATDAMSAMLCKAVIDCCVMNKVTGAACLTPCMSQITAASGYMSGAPLTAATNVGNCSMMKCGSVCM